MGDHSTQPLDTWRKNRESGWVKDVGYALQDVIGSHDYRYEWKGSKPDDPGWHRCSCGAWEGYWSGFMQHVADELRAAVVNSDWLAKVKNDAKAGVLTEAADGLDVCHCRMVFDHTGYPVQERTHDCPRHGDSVGAFEHVDTRLRAMATFLGPAAGNPVNGTIHTPSGA